MPKKIILCADGTGNKGGYTPDSNVYKMYQAIEIHDTTVTQYTYYDNGVGTSTNKIWRAISGGIGVGIKRNIKDLYAFLALNYEKGDEVFVFGFSRGAATIRALCDFINTVGLVDGRELNDEVLRNYTSKAFKIYAENKKNKQAVEDFYKNHNSHGQIPIHFIGVWDTVSAIGLPKRTDKMGLGLNILTFVFDLADTILDICWPHRFYEYKLNKNIKHAYQALAIDDQRTAFWPLVWDENGREENTVEQVWFSGVHSNVGGGYQRQGIANVTLHWMMLRAIDNGLTLKPGALEEAYEDSNIHGKLYNSRDGLAVYYRYHPREIFNLCKGKLLGNIKIHSSVLERLRKKTANYAPVEIPHKFDIVKSELDEPIKPFEITDNAEWNEQRKIIDAGVNTTKRLYGWLIDLSLIVAGYTIWFLSQDLKEGENIFSSLFSIATGYSELNSFLLFLVENHMHAILIFILSVIILYFNNKFAKKRLLNAVEKIRCIIVKNIKKDKI